MVRLEYSEALGRKIRKDDWDEIGISTWTKIKEAIADGRKEEAIELVDCRPSAIMGHKWGH